MSDNTPATQLLLTSGARTMPGLALIDSYLFPHCSTNVSIGRKPSVALTESIAPNSEIAFIFQRTATGQYPSDVADVLPVGVVGRISKLLMMPDGTSRAELEGTSRVAITSFVSLRPYLSVEVVPFYEHCDDKTDYEADLREIENLSASATDQPLDIVLLTYPLTRPRSSMNLQMLSETCQSVDWWPLIKSRPKGSAGRSARERLYTVLAAVSVDSATSIAILLEPSLNRQIAIALERLPLQALKAEWRRELMTKTTDAISKEHRRLFLNEQLRQIMDELGESISITGSNPVFRGHGFKVNSELGFVLMPFDPIFKPVFTEIVKPVVEGFGLRCVRADDLYGPAPIIEDVWRSINEARVIVSDVTGKNPNVFYETGLAHAVGKEVIIITQDLADVPFDLRHLRCIVYEDSVGGFRRIERELAETLSAIGLVRPKAAGS